MTPGSVLKPIDRAADDFYATPRSAVEQLLHVEKFFGGIWEPACGDGAISKVLQEAGHEVVSTDLVDRGYGVSGVDFLMERTTPCRSIVTNPPFKLATDFVRRALSLEPTPHKVAMLLKIGFLEGPTKSDLHSLLSRVWVIRRRVTFLKNGQQFSRSNGKGGIHTYAWFVWDQIAAMQIRPTEIGWLEGEACK